MPKVIFILAVLLAGPASAHEGHEHEGLVWTLDPWIVTPIAIIGILYAVGSLRLNRRSSKARLRSGAAAAFWSGWLSLALALLSPLHAFGEQLFTAHMVEHEILMAVSAPLLALSRPIGPIFWAFPRPARRWLSRAVKKPLTQASWNWLSRGATVTVLHGIAIWVWHYPPLFDATVTHVWVHRLQHWSFFLTALLFWWSMIWRSDYGLAAFDLLLTMLHTTILGALIALSPRIVYMRQTEHALAWGLAPIEDQQLAGIVMWVPAGIVYASIAVLMLALWINRSGKGGAHARRAKAF